jgi:hypothetical protein
MFIYMIHMSSGSLPRALLFRGALAQGCFELPQPRVLVADAGLGALEVAPQIARRLLVAGGAAPPLPRRRGWLGCVSGLELPEPRSELRILCVELDNHTERVAQPQAVLVLATGTRVRYIGRSRGRSTTLDVPRDWERFKLFF